MSARSPFPDDDDFDDENDKTTADTDDTDEDVDDEAGTDPVTEDDTDEDDADAVDPDEDDDDDVQDAPGDDADDYEDDDDVDDFDDDAADEDDEDDEDWDDEDTDLDEDDDEWSELDLGLDFDPADEDVADDADDEVDPEVDPEDDLDAEALRAALTKSRRENAARRKKFNDFRDQSMGAVEEAIADVLGEFAERIGVELGDSVDIDDLATAVSDRMSAKDKKAARAQRDLVIYRAAAPLGADLTKLADSKSFTEQIDALDTEDPGYADEVSKAIAAAMAINPTYKAAPEVARSGGDFTGGNSAPAPSDYSVEERRKRRRQRLEGK